MVGVVRVKNGSQSLGLRLESFLSGGVELATLLVEVLLSAEMFGFAVDVGAVLLLVATLASAALGEGLRKFVCVISREVNVSPR